MKSYTHCVNYSNNFYDPFSTRNVMVAENDFCEASHETYANSINIDNSNQCSLYKYLCFADILIHFYYFSEFFFFFFFFFKSVVFLSRERAGAIRGRPAAHGLGHPEDPASYEEAVCSS